MMAGQGQDRTRAGDGFAGKGGRATCADWSAGSGGSQKKDMQSRVGVVVSE